jgi:outer membrane biosynthesis protein TonB
MWNRKPIMNKNVLGGLAAVIALGAIFYFSQPLTPTVTPAAPARPAPVVVQPTVKPAPKPEVKVEPKPEAKKPEAPKPKVTFYRVEHGGKAGPAVECADVKSFADGKSPAELAVLAKQYGVTESELKRYYVCTN